MIITFKNLGRIQSTLLDLKPLTIITGPNNSNKTYIAYTLYGLYQYMNFYIEEEKVRNIPIVKNDKDNSFTIIIDSKIKNKLTNSIKSDINNFVKNIENFFQDTSKKIFKEIALQVNFSISEIIEGAKKIDSNDYTYVYSLKGNVRVPYRLDIVGNEIRVRVLRKFKDPKNYRKVFYEIVSDVISNIGEKMFKNVFLLPSERNALILTYKILSNRRFKLMRESKRLSRNYNYPKLNFYKEYGELIYPKPLEDFLDYLSEQEERYANNRIRISDNIFNKLSQKIEINLQNNNRLFVKKTKFGTAEFRIKINKNLDIDLYNASSSIKQLLPLILYLKNTAKPNDLLIIDEPEMNLHPEGQAKLLEILTILVNNGIYILLTTHSPYLMSHLNNLVISKKDLLKSKAKAKNLFLGSQQSFIDRENVSAYEMKNFKLLSLKDEDYGIRWDTLSEPASEIQEKYFKIAETK